jgi:methyl-accepting chemotaxis protein
VGAFIITSLFIYISVAFIYTSLLVRAMQRNFLENLRTNLRTFSYAVEQLKEKSLATTSLIASEKAIEGALAGGDTEELSSLAQEQMVSSKVDFLAVVDSQGTVMARGEEPEAVSDNLSSNLVVKEALEGRSAVNIATREWVSAQQVLVESASPVATSGAVYSGYVIDNAFVDGLKEATGLDLTVYSQEVKSATTLTASDNVSRLTGVKQSDEVITKKVLEEGEVFLGLSSVFQNEYLSAFGPFKNVKGEILGMFFVGQPSAALFKAAQDSLITAFYSIVILAVITFIPAYFLAKFIEKHQV